ncbi:MAG: hypothetical protein QXZ02_06015 [Candidatus Bathyarchaeia archaeon]
MAATMDKILDMTSLNRMFEDKKEKLVEAVWSYIDGYELVNETEPTPETLREFIRGTIEYLPSMVDFYVNYESTPEMKEHIIKYLIDKIYKYTTEKLVELRRGRIE